MKRTYRTLLLDLGGVLIDVDYRATADAFRDVGVRNFEALYSKAQQTDIFDRFETGELSAQDFRDAVRRITMVGLDDGVIDRCWNAMLGTVPRPRISLLQRLRKHHRLLLLSNTNAIHVPAFEQRIAEDLGIGSFTDLFHGAHYSCHIGLRKPHVEAFRYVLSLHDADPATTLFVDDSMQHVEGARRAGLHAEHLDLEKEDIQALCTRVGLDEL